MNTDGPLPPNVEGPGEVRYSDGSIDRVPLTTRTSVQRKRAAGNLGENVYCKDRSSVPPDHQPAQASKPQGNTDVPNMSSSQLPARRGPSSRKGTGTEELSFLATLIGDSDIGQHEASAATRMGLKLFDGDALFDNDSICGVGGPSTYVQNVVVDAVDPRSNEHLASIMASMSTDENFAHEPDGGEDLLDLLDA